MAEGGEEVQGGDEDGDVTGPAVNRAGKALDELKRLAEDLDLAAMLLTAAKDRAHANIAPVEPDAPPRQCRRFLSSSSKSLAMSKSERWPGQLAFGSTAGTAQTKACSLKSCSLTFPFWR